MTNEDYIKKISKTYPNLSALECHDNVLRCNGLDCDVSRLRLEMFFSSNKNLMNDLSLLSSLDVFQIISIHANAIKMVKANQLYDGVMISSFRSINEYDAYGLLQTYLYFLDSHGNSFFINDNSSLDCEKIYNDLLKKYLGTVSINALLREIDSYNNSLSLDDFKKLYPSNCDSFLNVMQDSMKYRNYLCSTAYMNYESFIEYIHSLDVQAQKSNDDVALVNRFQGSGLVLRKVNNGYSNGLIVIVLTIVLGIVLSLIVFSLER